MSEDVFLVLLGAGIALASGMIGMVGGHFLELRKDRIMRERDAAERIREDLTGSAEKLNKIIRPPINMTTMDIQLSNKWLTIALPHNPKNTLSLERLLETLEEVNKHPSEEE